MARSRASSEFNILRTWMMLQMPESNSHPLRNISESGFLITSGVLQTYWLRKTLSYLNLETHFIPHLRIYVNLFQCKNKAGAHLGWHLTVSLQLAGFQGPVPTDGGPRTGALQGRPPEQQQTHLLRTCEIFQFSGPPRPPDSETLRTRPSNSRCSRSKRH